MKGRITKRAVDALAPGDLLWDTEVSGFGVRAGERDKVYWLKYGLGGRHGRQPWLKLGRHGEITAEEARQHAIAARGAIATGGDPASDRDARNAEPTVKEFFENRYLVEHAIPFKKPRSVDEDRRNFKKHVLPALGTLRLSQVKRQDVLKIQHKLRATPGASNLTMALLSKMFGLAEEWGLRPLNSNPAAKIRKFKLAKRERFLTLEEIGRLGETLTALEDTEHPTGLAAIRLLMLTGCRLSEVLTLQWLHVDFEFGCLRLPDSKTDAKVVRLGAPALDLLSRLPRYEDSPYVFPRARGASISPNRKRRVGPGHFVGLGYIWQRVREKAQLDNLRLHDLRHTYASWAVNDGVPLYVTGALLGHTQPQTTARYAHVADDPIKAAADRVSAKIAAALAGGSGQKGDVVPLRRKR